MGISKDKLKRKKGYRIKIVLIRTPQKNKEYKRRRKTIKKEELRRIIKDKLER